MKYHNFKPGEILIRVNGTSQVEVIHCFPDSTYMIVRDLSDTYSIQYWTDYRNYRYLTKLEKAMK